MLDDDRPDTDLLAGARSGEAQAYGAFFRRHHALVLAYLGRRTGDGEAAADLLAETFAAALVAVLDTARQLPAEPVAWLMTIARNKLHGRATAEGRIKPATEILAGGTVTMRIGGRAPNGSVPPGTYRGSVTLVSATGPALFEGPGTVYLKVGSFAVRVP